MVFCGIMAVRSAKRQKRESQEKRQLRQTISQEMTRRGFILFFAILWLASGILTFVLHEMDLLNQTFKIPRVLLFFYDIFGIVLGSVIQVVLAFIVIIAIIYSMIRKRRKLLDAFYANTEKSVSVREDTTNL